MAVKPEKTPANTGDKLKIRKSFSGIFSEPSTYAGIGTIAATVASAGVGGLFTLPALSQLAAGLALVLMKEPKLQADRGE